MDNPFVGTHRHPRSGLLYEYSCKYELDETKREVAYVLTVRHGRTEVPAIYGVAEFAPEEFFEDALVGAIEQEINRL